jgi:archaellum component FlaC
MSESLEQMEQTLSDLENEIGKHLASLNSLKTKIDEMNEV